LLNNVYVCLHTSYYALAAFQFTVHILDIRIDKLQTLWLMQ